MKKISLLLIIWVGALFILTVFGRIYSADVYYEKAQAYLAKGDNQMAITEINHALQSNPREPNYYRGRARIYLVIATEDMDAQKSLTASALTDLQTAYQLNPANLVTIRNSVPLYYFLAVDLPSTYLPVATVFLETTKARFAQDAGVVSLVAKYEKRLGLTTEYAESVKLIAQLRPDLLDWYDSFR